MPETTRPRLSTTAPAQPMPAGPPLSPRETHVLRLVATGHRKDAIGEQLGVGASAITSTLRRIQYKVDTGDHAAMVDRAYRSGQQEPPERREALPDQHLDNYEQRIVLLISAGRTTLQIAADLRIAGNTAKTRTACLMTKLGAETRAHAVHIAWELGYLRSGEEPPPDAGHPGRTTGTGIELGAESKSASATGPTAPPESIRSAPAVTVRADPSTRIPPTSRPSRRR